MTRQAMRWMVAAVWLGGWGCGGGSDSGDGGTDTDGDTDGTTQAGELTATATLADNVPVVFVQIASDSADESFVEFGLAPDQLTRRTPSETVADPEHELLGLKGNHLYYWRAVVLSGGQRRESAIASIQIPPPPQALPRFTMSDTANGSAIGAGGWVQTSITGVDSSFVGILDGDGEWVWWWEVTPGSFAISSRPAADGRSLSYIEFDIAQVTDVGWVRTISLDGRDRVDTRALLAHHDFAALPDGRVAWLGFDDELETTVNAKPETVISDSIRVAAAGTATETDDRVYSWFEDYGHDVFAPCSHFYDPGPPAFPDDREWTHSNSLMVDPTDGHLWVMSKFLDALIKIDPDTGAIEEHIGGEFSDYTLPDGKPAYTTAETPVLWSHPHMSQLWDGGFMVFNNGYHYPSQLSRIGEYKFDRDKKTVEKVWEFLEPEGAFTTLMGDARKLPNGNYLGAWSTIGKLNEITPDGRIVWQAEQEIGFILGRVSYISDMYNLTTGNDPQ